MRADLTDLDERIAQLQAERAALAQSAEADRQSEAERQRIEARDTLRRLAERHNELAIAAHDALRAVFEAAPAAGVRRVRFTGSARMWSNVDSWRKPDDAMARRTDLAAMVGEPELVRDFE